MQERLEAMERRLEAVERMLSALHLTAFIVAGLILASVVVTAVEVRHVYQLVEAQAWRMR